MDDVATRMSKVGSSMLIIAVFFVVILALFVNLSWFTFFLLLAGMAVALRLNIARIDRKVARSKEPRRED